MIENDQIAFNNGVIERTARFRRESSMTAEQMAFVLSVPPDRYRKYETRSVLPAHLMPKFCITVGCDLEHLLIGKPRERTKPVLATSPKIKQNL
jgi:hypothetical protein